MGVLVPPAKGSARDRARAALGHLVIALIAGLFAAACSGESVAQPPPPPIDWRSFQVRPAQDAGVVKATDKERAVAEAYMKGLASPDFAQLAPILDDDVRFDFVGEKLTHGRERMLKALDELFGRFDKRSFVATRVWLTDNSQAIEWTMTGVHAREWMGIAATRKPVAFKGITLIQTKDDGTVTDVHPYFDVALVRAQLGAGPKELEALPAPAAPPTTGPQVFEETGAPSEEQNAAPVKAALDALERNDVNAYLATMTDDVEVQTLQRAQPARGKDEQRAYFTAMRKSIRQLDTTVTSNTGVGSYAIVEYFIAGEQVGPIGWVPARERVFRMFTVDVAEIRDGKIARIWRFDDPWQVATASSL
jgi:ketosteroid isomerase-like protein